MARLRVRAQCAAETWRARLLGGLDALHRGLWLGLIDRSDLHAATALYYGTPRRYRQQAYNRSGLRHWEQQAVARHFAGCRTVLVGGAGGGREVIALARQGLTVDGFECNARLVSIARELIATEGLQARMLEAPPDTVPEGLGSYDALLVGWGAYIHIPGRRRRVAFLRALRQRVVAGAPLIVSFFERPAASRRFAATRALARLIRRLRRCDDPVELGDVMAGSFDHYFTRDEIVGELDAAGFALVEYVGSDGSHPHAVGRAR